MSRCFPYPPPGYTLSRSSEAALIESIKLQKEREKAKERRKERRKEKKKRRKEKDEKRKERVEKRKERKEKANSNQNSDKYDISKGHYGKIFWAGIDHLEKSGLTEEHEQPIRLLIPSTSSDSTENSTRRKRDFYPVDCNHCHGNMIRIRMASKKQNFSNSSIDEHICSTSGRTDVPAQNKDGIGHRSKQEAIYTRTEETSKFGHGSTAKADKEELICLVSTNDAGAPGITGTSSVLDAVRSSFQKRESKFNKLFETRLPPQLEDKCLDTDDLDWLFSGNNQCNQAEKRLKFECDGMSCSSSSTSWQPHARFLPEVDIHALPFTCQLGANYGMDFCLKLGKSNVFIFSDSFAAVRAAHNPEEELGPVGVLASEINAMFRSRIFSLTHMRRLSHLLARKALPASLHSEWMDETLPSWLTGVVSGDLLI